MNIVTMPVGVVGTNAYILHNDGATEAVLIDPGCEATHIQQELEKRGLTLVAILLTHGHFDHIGAVDALREALGVDVYSSELEAELAADTYLNGCKPMRRPEVVCTVTKYIEGGQMLNIAGLEIHAISTPGHTHGHLCFHLPAHSTLFSGDCLFKGSYGRHDLPTSDFDQLKASLFRLFELPDDTDVYPGHGSATTIKYEKKHNPINRGR
ncbi:MAG: MBL fold metallo-hydrolase [Defluviitaleaceae bacterium]|nr:MBL fold metallo-hydrolase [Defluviitaleaceae bacterium]